MTLHATSAAEFIPATTDLQKLRAAAQACRGCDLYRRATQAVFGEGAANAKLMLVGEQPGDEEDMAGRPFVGPSGRMLDKALAEIGIERSTIYITNAVKHFKCTVQGKRRLHLAPTLPEIAACAPWLKTEIHIIKPKVIVCLGVTALHALVSRSATLRDMRGKWLKGEHGEYITATYHPAAILRAKYFQQNLYGDFVSDLREAIKVVKASVVSSVSLNL